MKKQLRFLGKLYDYNDAESEVVIKIGPYSVNTVWCAAGCWGVCLKLRGSVILDASGRGPQSALTALERKIERIAALKETK